MLEFTMTVLLVGVAVSFIAGLVILGVKFARMTTKWAVEKEKQFPPKIGQTRLRSPVLVKELLATRLLLAESVEEMDAIRAATAADQQA